jgi:outer membrane protein assembly factor BamB
MFNSTPAVTPGGIVVSSRSGRLWRISPDTGDWGWKDRKTNGDVVAGLAMDSNAVYVPCLEQRVYAFRADTGGELWERQLAGRLEISPTLTGPCVLVISQDHVMYALRRTNGEIKWQVPDVTRVAAIEDGAVWVADTAGNLKLIAVDDGSQRTSAQTPGIQLFIRNTADKRVFMVGTDGTVAAYTPMDQ